MAKISQKGRAGANQTKRKAVSKAPTPKKASTKKTTDNTPKSRKIELSQEQIAIQAYRIWEAKGCLDGHENENWFEAVETLKQKHSRA